MEPIDVGEGGPEQSAARPFQTGPQPIKSVPAPSEPADRDFAFTKVDAAVGTPRRPVTEGTRRQRSDVPWLGIGSWVLLCAALFASLLGWPGQTALDRITAIWPGEVSSTVLAGRTERGGAPSTQAARAPEPNRSAEAPDAADPPTLPPVDLAPPIRSDSATDSVERTPGSPPLPRFKPSVDRVAAEFSNAFFEMGEQLQEEGDYDAAVHMRRQGVNLDPWKAVGASDL